MLTKIENKLKINVEPRKITLYIIPLINHKRQQ